MVDILCDREGDASSFYTVNKKGTLREHGKGA
jgi:hypothetical protein